MRTFNASSKTLITAIGTAMALSAFTANASPFEAKVLGSGYQVAADDHKAGEGKCGEGKCGGDKKKEEGKCGEGKCGADKKKEEGKCGEGKCGANK